MDTCTTIYLNMQGLRLQHLFSHKNTMTHHTRSTSCRQLPVIGY